MTLVTACGGGGGGSAPEVTSAAGLPTLNIPPSQLGASNVLPVTVDAGPANTGYNVNRLYTDVTICQPGSSTQCQTIHHVLVDTGSTGLRLLSSAMAPALNLNRQTVSAGLPLLNCAQFVDNTFAWGPVATADIWLAGKTAANVPIQIIADQAYNSQAAACSVGGSAITTAAVLGANGIIGLGLFKEDCGSGCAAITNNGFYYTCTDATCAAISGVKISKDQQVKNPVALFATDNNGVLIDLPAVSAAGASTLSGSLVFGISTQSNNQFTSGAILTTSASGYITTVLAGQSLSTSFIDTGSNGLYFDSSTIPRCTGSSAGFYCPTSLTTLSATLRGANTVAAPVSFSVDNASAMFVGGTKTVLPTLAGNIGDSNTFDWGLPFFYGRRVFIGIEGQSSTLGTGPLYAF
ncbi:DUF3443 domain-containing protein [Rhodoferax ferrireducens]|uniref:DUF3443 domain-containing protein n=1 Tax=Rhodoferax ferrireducens TaxID=192843 RepID=UPI001E540C99|nr:DUF3443 domain-containing protein [Rhodoferax ferrireducens]